MSKKHMVCSGATCKCKYGATPDKLVVTTQSRHYINDKSMSKKLVATHVDIGQPFLAKTFGKCKITKSKCSPAITKWSGAYKGITYQDNGGNPLLEDSKATCSVAGSPCVQIIDHGQTSEMSQNNIDNADADALAELNPMVNTKAIK